MAHYVTIPDQGSAPGFNPLKTASRLVGLMVVGVTGWAATHRASFYQASSSGSVQPFFPKQGMESVILKPGDQKPVPAGPRGNGGPTAIFLYGTQPMPADVGKSATVEDGYIYGAKINCGKGKRGLACITGSPGDIIKGRLLEWPTLGFADKLRACDNLCQTDKAMGYDTAFAKQGSLRRGIAQVVSKDGSVTKAHFYFQAPDKNAPAIPTAPKATSVALTLALADKMADAAVAKALKFNIKPITVVVVDDSGEPLVVKRMDGCQAPSFPQFALAKAYSCVQLGIASTRELRDKYQAQDKASQINSMVAITEGKLAVFPGGVLFKGANGNVLGAIGVSGASSDEDEACAMAGVDAGGFTTDAKRQ
eukprot:gb/GEZN01005315.1/.p1 GENE.gb/GEZN01005315.1/~~gb/GEZN01005315.1/.p1  ORF type:complete len:365 (-),score=84.88 gb/GEZN01005315.1/:627-1721(-)